MYDFKKIELHKTFVHVGAQRGVLKDAFLSIDLLLFNQLDNVDIHLSVFNIFNVIQC